LRRLVTVASSAILVLMLLGAGIATASTPGWAFTNTATLPATVTPGADAGFQFDIVNQGKSNISQLYLTTSDNAVPSYFSNSRGTVCQLSPTLFCAFGALNAGDSIHVLIAYTTPTLGSSFGIIFQINGTGVSFTDPHRSHGDTLSQPFTTALSADPNFAGGFQIKDGTTYTTNNVLSKRNDQSSAATSGALLVPVTIQDGLTTPPDGATDPCATLHCIGDWTALQVGNGTDGPVKVTLVLYGKSVPNGATVDNIGLWHQNTLVSLRCSDPSSIPNGGTNECVTVTLVGINFQIVAWLLHNGGLHGTY
jgi:hypothetical protein